MAHFNVYILQKGPDHEITQLNFLKISENFQKRVINSNISRSDIGIGSNHWKSFNISSVDRNCPQNLLGTKILKSWYNEVGIENSPRRQSRNVKRLYELIAIMSRICNSIQLEMLHPTQWLFSRPTRWSLWYWYLDVCLCRSSVYFQIQVT